jgi:hypothetical protein
MALIVAALAAAAATTLEQFVGCFCAGGGEPNIGWDECFCHVFTVKSS